MVDLVSLIKDHLNEVSWGGGVIVAALGILRERIFDTFKVWRAKAERKKTETALATISEDVDLHSQVELQERLARLKVRSGELIGVRELAELQARKQAERRNLDIDTKRLLARKLGSLDPNHPTFRDLLSILCSSLE